MLIEVEKIALITGSATRIGRFIAENLANDGWKIAIHYHNSKNEAYELANSLISYADIMVFQSNLNDSEQASNLISQVKKHLGPINLLINNAATHKNDNIDSLNQTSLEEALQLNLQAPLYLSQGIAKQNIEANIINIIDSNIIHNSNKFFSYSLSKKSLASLTQMLAFNLAPKIRVNGIAPGPILFKEGQNPEVFNQMINESPLRTKASLQELYQSIIFLINSPSITGQLIHLDSGSHLL